MENLFTVLKNLQFFQSLKYEYIELLVSCAKNVRFRENEFIFHHGESADSFYIIREGIVALCLPDSGEIPLTIQTLDDGDVLGWSWLFPPYFWHFDAYAEVDTRAISLDGKCLRQKCEENHELGYELMKRFSLIVDHRLEATRLQLADVYK